MQDLDVAALPVAGVLEVLRRPTGVSYSRLPAWAREQIGDGYLDLMASMPAGGRLAFRTSSPALELDVSLTTLRYGHAERPDPAFDLVVDGELRSTTRATAFAVLRATSSGLERVPGGPVTLRFELPGSDQSIVELWLPHDAAVTIRSARVEPGTGVVPLEPRPRWVHYGSSISQCLEAVRPTETWPAAVARSLDLDLTCLGLGGQCALDQQVARVLRDLPADVLSLKVGTNLLDGDLMRERVFRPALHAFLDTVREGHPTTSITVVTPVHCPAGEDRPGPMTFTPAGRFEVLPRPAELARGALTLNRIREITREVVASREDHHLKLVDGPTLLGPADAERFHDGLHPDAEGYRLMAARFDPSHLLPSAAVPG